MLTRAEIARGTQGAFKLLQRDPSAPAYFDNTFEACLRSFWMMALVAPLYALYVLLTYSAMEYTAEPLEVAAVEALRYVVDWLFFPVVFYEVARRRRWLDRYPRYIAALNWIALPAMIALLAHAAVTAIAPSPFPTIFGIVVQALLFYWIATTSRLALGVDWGMAAVLLVVNWVPSFFLSLIVSRFLGVAGS